MKTAKKSKRTNWKQRALLADERAKHCEHVIEVQNQAAKAAELRTNRYIAIGAESVKRAQAAEKDLKDSENFAAQLESNIKFLKSRLEGEFSRAESAEKHNALLLEEREKWNTPVIVRDLDTWPAGFVQVGVPDCCKESLCRGGAMEESWKRLKAWAKGIRQRKPKEVTTRL